MNATETTRRPRDPVQAGWRYGQSGACHDRVAAVSYPWHEEYVGPVRAKRGRCVRCGEMRPKDTD